VQIVRCDASQDPLWNAFVERCPRASFYHRAEWRLVNERSFGHRTAYLAAFDAGQIVGVFPLVRLKSVLFGNLACSMPFVNYGGPAGDSDAVETALLAEATGVAAEWGVDYLEIRGQHRLSPPLPTSNHKVSMTIGLNRDPNVVWEAYRATSGPRQDIRRGYKNGFTGVFGGLDLLDPFYDVLSESWRDLGTPIYRRSYLRSVLETFGTDVRICVVRAGDGTPAAAALCGHHRDIVEGMWLGVRATYRRQMAGYVLYWELIKDACERGYTMFHLGRSTTESGGEQFKRKWNAAPMQLHWQYVLRTVRHIPSLNVASPRYQLAIKAWQKLPVPVTRMIGPFIARSIP
jgi:FemAB-related protein (PEP-CTERM system-associated)